MAAPVALLPIALGVASGMLRSKEQERKQAEDKRVTSAMTSWSPWTGMRGQLSTSEPSYFSNILKGGLAGHLGNKNKLKNLSTYESLLDENPAGGNTQYVLK